MRNSSSILLVTSLMALSLAACTRPKGETADVSFSLPAKQASSMKGLQASNVVTLDEMLQHATVRISVDGKLVDGGTLDWDACHGDDSSCVPTSPNFTFSVPTNKSVTFQLLAVYQTNQVMTFYYKDVTETLTGDKNIAMPLEKLAQNVVSGHASGRYLTGVDQGPTAIVDVVYEPAGKLPMKIESSVMLNGWFDVFMLYGLPLKYVAHTSAGDKVLWNKAMSFGEPEMNPSNTSSGQFYQVFNVYYPVGVRYESGSSVQYTQEEARVHSFGYWADPNAPAGVLTGKRICRDYNGGATLNRIRKYEPLATINQAAGQTLQSKSYMDPIPTPAALNQLVSQPIVTKGGDIWGSSPCNTYGATDEFVNYQRPTLAQIDTSQDDQAGFRNFMRAMPNGTGSKYFDITGTTTKTISGKVLPGLENLFTSIRFYKNTATPNNRVKYVDCNAIVAGKTDFKEGSLTSATVASDGTLSITSNITATEATAGVSGAICGMTGASVFPVGIYLDKWNFSQGSANNGPAMATKLKIVSPQGPTMTTARIGNEICTPLVILGLDANDNSAQLPGYYITLETDSEGQFFPGDNCGGSVSQVSITGGNQQMVFVKRSGSNTATSLFTVTARDLSNNPVATGTGNITFQPVTDTSKVIKIDAPVAMNAYECYQVKFKAFNGPSEDLMVPLGDASIFTASAPASFHFFSDGNCVNPASPSVSFDSTVSRDYFVSVDTPTNLSSQQIDTGSISCTSGTCAPQASSLPIAVTAPGSLSYMQIGTSSMHYQNQCEEINVAFADAQGRRMPGLSAGPVISMTSSDSTLHFYSDTNCTSSAGSIGNTTSLYTRFWMKSDDAISHSFTVTVNGTSQPMTFNYKPQYSIVLSVNGQSYDPVTNTVVGTPSALVAGSDVINARVTFQQFGMMTTTSILSGTYIRTGAGAETQNTSPSFSSGYAILGYAAGPTPGTTKVKVQLTDPNGDTIETNEVTIQIN